MSVLVYGEVGVGKSTFVKECGGTDAVAGKDSDGVTKAVTQYTVTHNGFEVGLVDCPGFGDGDVAFQTVLSDLAELCHSGKWLGIIFIISAYPAPRFTVGAQFVAKLLGLAFGSNKSDWHSNVVVVASNWDAVLRQSDDDIANTEKGLQKCVANICKKANMSLLPPQQVFKKGLQANHGQVIEFFQALAYKNFLDFKVPEDADMMHAFGEVFHKGEGKDVVAQMYIEQFQAPRQAECLKRLEVATSKCEIDTVQHILSTCDLLFGPEEQDRLMPYKKKLEDWTVQCDENYAKIKQKAMSPDFEDIQALRDLAKDPPHCNYLPIQSLLGSINVQNLKDKSALSKLYEELEKKCKRAESNNPYEVVLSALLGFLDLEENRCFPASWIDPEFTMTVPLAKREIKEAGGIKRFCLQSSGRLAYKEQCSYEGKKHDLVEALCKKQWQ